MGKIWNDIEIDFRDETFTVRPSMDLINYLEQDRGRSLTQLYTRLANGDMPSGMACELIAKVINWANKDDKEKPRVTVEEIYFETNGGVGKHVVDTCQTILLACIPAEKSDNPTKKSEARKTTSRKRTPRKSTGQKSTA
jgi:hypothetical protein